MINSNVDLTEFNRKIAQIRQTAGNLKPVMAAIGNRAVGSVKQNFAVGGRPTKWAPLSTAYASQKKGGKLLMATGRLAGSIHYEANSDSATIMTDKLPYARIHNFGGQNKPHEIKARNKKSLAFMAGGVPVMRKKVNHPGSIIPARPYMVLQDEDIATFGEMIAAFLVEKVK
jgi:phage virion morphogenesis protein